MIKIGKPFAPSTIINSQEFEMTEIMLSCGGGMGGSRWELYTQDNFDLNEKFIKVQTNRGVEQTINTNNIVQTRPVRFVKLTIRNDGNKNMLQPVGTIQDYYYLLQTGPSEKVEIVNDYHDNKNCLKIDFLK